MKRGKLNLKQFIETIDWEMIEPQRNKAGLPNDGLAIGFMVSPKSKDNKVDRILVRFGKDLMEKLNWNTHDRVILFYDESGKLNFKLVKTENGSGYKLFRESNSLIHRVQIKYAGKKELFPRRTLMINYHIVNNQILVLHDDFMNG